jgi:tetratricopeptide (TPR) repeat protein
VGACLVLRTVLATEGRAEEGEEISRGQIDYFPYLGYAHFSLGKDLFVQRRYRESELEFMRAHALEPFGLSGPNGSVSFASLARRLDGRANIDALAARLGDEVAAAELKRIYASDGDRGILRWLAKYGDGPVSTPFGRAFNAAVCYALAGDADDALAALERLPPMTDSGQLLLLPVFDGLRDEPRYQAIIEQLGLTAYHAKYLKRPP